jgi:transcriptional regulator with XRE-family HTH domain
MIEPTAQTPASLGAILRQARARAGLSLRNLEAITGIARAKLNRLEHDQHVENETEVLQRLAEALEINSDALFALAHDRPSETLPSLTPYLRAKYHLPPEALTAASEALRDILDKYDQDHGVNE